MSNTNDASVERWLKTARRHCAILKAGDRVANNARGGSYFGGHPKLALELAWPTIAVNGTEASMLFLGQIDLNDLPDFERRQLLPPQGTLYFFYLDRWDWEGDRSGVMPCAVLYHQHSAADFAPQPPPFPLAPENPDLGEMGVHPDDGARADILFATFQSFPDDNEIELGELSRSQRETVEAIVNAGRLDSPPHQLLGHACSEHIFVGSEQMPEHMSLLRISSGETIFRGSPEVEFEGAFNFWITPEDLARRDFASVRMSC